MPQNPSPGVGVEVGGIGVGVKVGLGVGVGVILRTHWPSTQTSFGYSLQSVSKLQIWPG